MKRSHILMVVLGYTIFANLYSNWNVNVLVKRIINFEKLLYTVTIKDEILYL